MDCRAPRNVLSVPPQQHNRRPTALTFRAQSGPTETAVREAFALLRCLLQDTAPTLSPGAAANRTTNKTAQGPGEIENQKQVDAACCQAAVLRVTSLFARRSGNTKALLKLHPPIALSAPLCGPGRTILRELRGGYRRPTRCTRGIYTDCPRCTPCPVGRAACSTRATCTRTRSSESSRTPETCTSLCAPDISRRRERERERGKGVGEVPLTFVRARGTCPEEVRSTRSPSRETRKTAFKRHYSGANGATTGARLHTTASLLWIRPPQPP